MKSTSLFLALALAGWPAAGLLAAPPHTHAHGKAELELTIQEGKIQGVFRSPMDNLLGFEHMPKTDTQKRSVEQLRQKLSDPSKFFRPSVEAQCTPQAVEVRSSMFSGAVTSGHSDLEYRFGFDCKKHESLKQIEATLFADYPRLHEIQSQLVTATAQRGITLKKNNRRIIVN